MFDKFLPTLMWIGGIIFLLIVLRIVFWRISKWIVKVPPDKALIVYGAFAKSTVKVLRKVPDTGNGDDSNAYKLTETDATVSFKIIQGGASIVIPMIQDKTTLDLGLMTLDVRVENVLSSQAVPITVDGIAQIKIGGNTTYIATAAEQLLNKTLEQLQHVARETLMGHLRAIIGLMTVEDAFKNREAFSQRVQEVAVEDMAGMGFEIKSFVIKDIDDAQGYIKALGAPEIQGKLRDERIATAMAVQTARESEANTDLVAQTAEINRDKEVIVQNEGKDLREVEKERNVGMAKASKEREIQELLAKAVEQQKEAEVIVPARAEAAAKKIFAEGEQQKITITASADAQATRTKAAAAAEETTIKGQATANATKAGLLAAAEGTRAQLEAEADGKLKLANAIAAEGQINVRQALAEAIIKGEVAKAEAIAQALGLIGSNVKIVQFAGGENQNQGNALMQLLSGVPEFATRFNAQVEALSGSSTEELLTKVMKIFQGGETLETSVKAIKPGKSTPVNKAVSSVSESTDSDNKAAQKSPQEEAVKVVKKRPTPKKDV